MSNSRTSVCPIEATKCGTRSLAAAVASLHTCEPLYDSLQERVSAECAAPPVTRRDAPPFLALINTTPRPGHYSNKGLVQLPDDHLEQ